MIQIVSLSGERDTGAVASAEAAKIYGLDILAEKIQVRNFFFFFNLMCLRAVNMNSHNSMKIVSHCPDQDDDDNITRFLILAREPIIAGTDRPYKVLFFVSHLYICLVLI